jgi:hypothetical protein
MVAEFLPNAYHSDPEKRHPLEIYQSQTEESNIANVNEVQGVTRFIIVGPVKPGGVARCWLPESSGCKGKGCAIAGKTL